MSETETQEVMDNETVVTDPAEAMAEQMLKEASVEDETDPAEAMAEQMLAEASVEDGTDTSMTSGEADSSEPISIIREEEETIEAVGPKNVQLPDTPEMQRILQLQVPIIVRLALKVLPLGEITQFTPGVIIEFDKEVDEKLDLMINNKCIGNGQAVKIGEKFGLKVTNLGSLEQMIKAMGT